MTGLFGTISGFLTRGNRRRMLRAVVAAFAILGPIGWLWETSLLPATYSITNMGYADYGGGQSSSMGGMPMAGRSVAPLTEARSGPADVNFTLIARKQKFRLVSGRVVDGYTLNGSSPGPVIHAEQGN
ncbi:MAG: hypothetical protein WBV74_00480 [Pseudonocardiaceae bacterium]